MPKIEIPLQFILVGFLILGLSVFLGLYFFQKVEEPFVASQTNPQDLDIQLQACPSGTNSFSQNGDIICCDGDIVNAKCNGRTVCSVSSDTGSVQSCVSLLRKTLREKATRFCPRTLPNYFENKTTKVSGCTDGRRNTDGTAPETTTQPKCTIYTSFTENQNKLDSCENIRQRDTFRCPGGQTPTLISTNPNYPVLVQCTFNSINTPQPLICYSDKSYLDHLNVAKPDWRGSLTKEAKLAFCSNAQRYYLDRSLNDTDLASQEGPYIA